MRFTFIVLVILFVTACASNNIEQPIPKLSEPLEIPKPPINIDKLELREDSYYEMGNITPYSGNAYSEYLFEHNKEFGSFSSGEIINGKKQGIWEIRYISNGKIWNDYIYATLQYRDGKLNGQKRFYETDGSITGRESYKNDLQHGLAISYHDNGKLAYRGFFKDGERHGEESKYFDNGQLQYSSTYKDGLLTDNGESLIFYKNGQIHSKSILKYGVTIGTSIIYFPDGTIQIKSDYRNGKREGRTVTYYENGIVNSIQEHRDDKLNGSSVYYREDGSLESRVVYENDEILKANFYDYEGNLDFSK